MSKSLLTHEQRKGNTLSRSDHRPIHISHRAQTIPEHFPTAFPAVSRSNQAHRSRRPGVGGFFLPTLDFDKQRTLFFLENARRRKWKIQTRGLLVRKPGRRLNGPGWFDRNRETPHYFLVEIASRPAAASRRSRLLRRRRCQSLVDPPLLDLLPGVRRALALFRNRFSFSFTYVSNRYRRLFLGLIRGWRAPRSPEGVHFSGRSKENVRLATINPSQLRRDSQLPLQLI